MCELNAVSTAGGKSLHVSPHLLAPVGWFRLISPSHMHQPHVRLCPQPLNQSLYALFSLDCTRPVLSALGLWSSLTCQLVLLVLSLLLLPLNPSICFLSTSARFPASLVTGLSFLFPYPVSPSNSFLPGTQPGSLLIPASGS